jgi:polyisoprenoid-binding protein YceI
MKKLILLFAALLAITVPALAVDTYKIDGAHSSANFTVKHMGISTVHGRFADVSGTILFDANNSANSSVTAVIKVASINTDNAMRDKHLNGEDFFDSAKFPEIRFQSTSVKALGGDKYVAVGNLTMKDVTKQVEIPFNLATGKNKKGQMLLGVDAALSIVRYDYHVNFDPTGMGVSKDVKIELSIEAVGN